MAEQRFLKLKEPLPCGVVLPDGQLCGKPVFEVLANTMLRQGNQDQAWRMVPVCDEHLTDRLSQGRSEVS